MINRVSIFSTLAIAFGLFSGDAFAGGYYDFPDFAEQYNQQFKQRCKQDNKFCYGNSKNADLHVARLTYDLDNREFYFEVRCSC